MMNAYGLFGSHNIEIKHAPRLRRSGQDLLTSLKCARMIWADACEVEYQIEASLAIWQQSGYEAFCLVMDAVEVLAHAGRVFRIAFLEQCRVFFFLDLLGGRTNG